MNNSFDEQIPGGDVPDLTKQPPRRSRKSRNNVPTADLEPHECKWPMNDGPNWLHCGNRRGGGPYCLEHAKRAYNSGANRHPIKPASY